MTCDDEFHPTKDRSLFKRSSPGPRVSQGRIIPPVEEAKSMDTPKDASIFDKKIEDPTNRVIQGEVITPEEGDPASGPNTPLGPSGTEIVTRYKLEHGKVVFVHWGNGDGDTCAARLADDGESYNYSSMLVGDTSEAPAPNAMSLVDCVLMANVHMGLIPPHILDSIACRNQH